MNEIKNIVEAGLTQGWSKNNIISQIAIRIATDEEKEVLMLQNEIPELTERATELYEKYREDYYKEVE